MIDSVSDDGLVPYMHFLERFPGPLSLCLDTLRANEYERLDITGETYMVYMGGTIHPESLARLHHAFLARNGLSSSRPMPDKYTVIFTPSASAALKLVGESYPFTPDSSFVLWPDSHNNVKAIREFAMRRGVHVASIPATETGGFDVKTAQDILSHSQTPTTPSLFVMTSQIPIHHLERPKPVRDAAVRRQTGVSHRARRSGPRPNREHLLARASRGRDGGVSFQHLRVRWRGGVRGDVGVPEPRLGELQAQFEEGKINYLSLPAVTDGLRLLSAYMPVLPMRLSALTHYFSLAARAVARNDCHARHAHTVCDPGAARHSRWGAGGRRLDCNPDFSPQPSGNSLPNAFIQHAAARMRISLGTGFFENPGDAAAMLGVGVGVGREVRASEAECEAGELSVSVVRISLGLARNFQDVWTVLRFAELVADCEGTRRALWE
ncbi:PLP-dependent transferase [Mycena crocata]|nr:PLP-dependent transferase [Mycena crocata]